MKKQGNKLKNMLQEKCPNCGVGQVFYKRQSFFSLPKMKENCDICKYHFEREPGYFLGAMYISYGLAVFQGILTFLICYYYFPDMETLYVVLSICGIITLFSMKNYKLSRVIYMNIFPE